MTQQAIPFVDHELNRRFTDNVAFDGTCLIWTGCRNGGGYGVLHRGGGSRLIHRIAYELVNGSIPSGLDLDHLCRNRACFNPDHLEPVTRGENVRRGHPYRQRKRRCKVGHLIEGDNAREIYDRGRVYLTCLECRRRTARDYMRRQRSAAG